MTLLPPRSDAYYAAASCLALGQALRPSPDALARLVADMRSTWDIEQATPEQARALSRFFWACVYGGVLGEIDDLADCMDRLPDAIYKSYPDLAGEIDTNRALRARTAGETGAALELWQRAITTLDSAGEAMMALRTRIEHVRDLIEVGAHELVDERLNECLAQSDRMKSPRAKLAATHYLGAARLARGDAHGALEVAMVGLRGSSAEFIEQTRCQYALAQAHLELGHVDLCREAVETVLRLCSHHPAVRLNALAVLTRLWLNNGRVHEAFAVAREVRALLDAHPRRWGTWGGEAFKLLVWPEALIAVGRIEEGQAGLAAARDRLLERAGRIADPALRASFLGRVPSHVRTLKLAGPPLIDR
jgi:tetratricopeptide (TPR) repeat protein